MAHTTVIAPVESFDQMPAYTQDSGANISYRLAIKPTTMGRLSAGVVRLTGPARKAADTHAGWDQMYLIISGRGEVQVNGKSFPVSARHVVRIPEGTHHAVSVAEGETLEYVYVNAFSDLKVMASAAEYFDKQGSM